MILRQDAGADAAVAAGEAGTGGGTGAGGVVETGGGTGTGGITGFGGSNGTGVDAGFGGQGAGGLQALGGSAGSTLPGTGGQVPSDASSRDTATDDGDAPTRLCADAGTGETSSSTTITIGGFDASRGGQCGVATGAFLLQLREQMVAAKFPGINFVLTGGATLTPAYLATLDILVITSTASNTSAITPLSLAEQDAVSAFIRGGGRFLISSDNSTFGGAATEEANNSLLAPLHMTAGGMTLSGKQPMQAADPSSPLVSGRFGTWSLVDTNYAGSWKSTGPVRVVGYLNGSQANPALAQLDDGALAPGSGRGVVIADMNAMVDYSGANIVMLDNILDYLIAGLRIPDCRPSSGP
jgi:hypothetical protein